MKRVFIFMVMSMAAFAVSCSTEDAVGTLGLTSSEVMHFSQEGGEGVISYAIQGAKGDAKVEAVCEAEWVTITEVGREIKFTVAPNDNDEERMAMILLSYAKQSAQVVIEQQGKPNVEFVASKLNGMFEGKNASHPNAYKYTVILSKNGTTGEMDYYSGDSYYKFIIYSSVPTVSNARLSLGEYLYDAENTYEAGTFSSDMSEVVISDEDGKQTIHQITGGRVVVSNDMVEALITLNNGEVHKVTYSGSLALSFLDRIVSGPFSTLTEDYSFDIENGYMLLIYDGDAYGVGNGSWDVRFMAKQDMSEGDFFRFTVAVDDVSYNDELLYRSFVCDEDATFAAGTFKPGRLDEELNFSGSWYLPLEKASFTSIQAPFVGGSVSIERHNTTEAIVKVDVVDDRGHKVVGTCHCSLVELLDRTGM
ncbi:MAG: BACON domain-containing protein [Alistipes sp.]|nr:BACON domain-containing protein [Alistipes sp.]